METIANACWAIAHVGTTRVYPLVRPLVRHPDKDVRRGVAFALRACLDAREPTRSRGIDLLEELAEDVEPGVRDIVMIVLHYHTGDSRIREILARHLPDDDLLVREGAMKALADAGDPRVFQSLLAELAGDTVGTEALRAACELADPRFHPALLALRERWTNRPHDHIDSLLDDAISACDPDSAPDAQA